MNERVVVVENTKTRNDSITGLGLVGLWAAYIYLCLSKQVWSRYVYDAGYCGSDDLCTQISKIAMMKSWV
jgi:hypothetical protein